MTSQDTTKPTSLIKVGSIKEKWVTPLNNELYLAAAKIMSEANESFSCPHMGYYELGVLIDWLEEHYTIQKK